jgi:hypothetical protein
MASCMEDNIIRYVPCRQTEYAELIAAVEARNAPKEGEPHPRLCPLTRCAAPPGSRQLPSVVLCCEHACSSRQHNGQTDSVH